MPSFRRSWRVRILSLLVALSLSLPYPFLPLVQAAEARSFSTFNLDELTIPPLFGKIEELFPAKSNQTVLLIQDAHGIIEAQQNISAIIRHLQTAYGIDRVLFEGASASIDAELFANFPDKKLLDAVLREYMARAELTGVNDAALRGDSRIHYQGIEDWALFEKGTEAFIHSLESERSLLKEAAVLQDAIGQEKKKVYSPEFLELDRLITGFWNNETGLAELLQGLERYGKPKKGFLLDALSKELREKDKNFKHVEDEVLAAAEKAEKHLRGTGPREVFMAFNEKYQAFKTSRLGAKEFALYLDSLNIPDVKFSKAVYAAAEGARRLKDISGPAFFSELQAYIEQIKTAHFRTDEERALDRKSHAADLIGRMIQLELTRPDWDELRGLCESKEKSCNDAAALWEKAAHHKKFYEIASEREDIFISKIKSAFKHRPGSPVILTAGGFHTRGLTERLSREGISWGLITPGISEIPEDNSYRAQMLGDVSWSGYFLVSGGKINLSEAFIRALRDRLLEKHEGDTGVLLKLWRDELIRGLAEKGKIESSKDYTKYLDSTVSLHENGLEEEWTQNAERFIAELKKLERSGRLDRQSVVSLIRQMTSVQMMLSASLVRDAKTGLYVQDGRLKKPAVYFDPDDEEPLSGAALLDLAEGLEPAAALSELRAEASQEDQAFRQILEKFAGEGAITLQELEAIYADPQLQIDFLTESNPKLLEEVITLVIKGKDVKVVLGTLLKKAAAARAKKAKTEAQAPAVLEGLQIETEPLAAPRPRGPSKQIRRRAFLGGMAGGLILGLGAVWLLTRDEEEIPAPAPEPEPEIDEAPVPAPPAREIIEEAPVRRLPEEVAAYARRQADAFGNYGREDTGYIRFSFTDIDGNRKTALAPADHIAAGERMNFAQPLGYGYEVNHLTQQIKRSVSEKTLKDLSDLLDHFDVNVREYGAPVAWTDFVRTAFVEFEAKLSARTTLEGRRVGHSAEDYLGFLSNALVAIGALSKAAEDPKNQDSKEEILRLKARLWQTVQDLKPVMQALYDSDTGRLWGSVHLESGKAPEAVKDRYIDRFSEDMEATFLAVALGFLPEEVLKSAHFKTVRYTGRSGNTWTAIGSVYGAAFQMPGYNRITGLELLVDSLDKAFRDTEAAFIDLAVQSGLASVYPGSAYISQGQYHELAGHPALAEVQGVRSDFIVPAYAVMSGHDSLEFFYRTFGAVDLTNPANGIPYESLYRDTLDGEDILAGVPYSSSVVALAAANGIIRILDGQNGAEALDITVFLKDEGLHGIEGLYENTKELIVRTLGRDLKFFTGVRPEAITGPDRAPVRVISEDQLPAKITEEGSIEIFKNLMPIPGNAGAFEAVVTDPNTSLDFLDNLETVFRVSLKPEPAADRETAFAYWKVRSIDPSKFGAAEIVFGEAPDFPAAGDREFFLEIKDAAGIIGGPVKIDENQIKQGSKAYVDLTQVVEAAAGRGPVTEIVFHVTGRDFQGTIPMRNFRLHLAERNVLKRAAAKPALGIFTEKPNYPGNTTSVENGRFQIEINLNDENKTAGIFLGDALNPALYRSAEIKFAPDALGNVKVPPAKVRIMDPLGQVIDAEIPLDLPPGFAQSRAVTLDLSKVRETAIRLGIETIKEIAIDFARPADLQAYGGQMRIESIIFSTKPAAQPAKRTVFDVDLPEKFDPMKAGTINKEELVRAVIEKLPEGQRPLAGETRSRRYFTQNPRFIPPIAEFFKLNLAGRSKAITDLDQLLADIRNWNPAAYEDLILGLYLRYWVRELNERGPKMPWQDDHGPVSAYAERARLLIDRGKNLNDLRNEILQLKSGEPRSELRAPDFILIERELQDAKNKLVNALTLLIPFQRGAAGTREQAEELADVMRSAEPQLIEELQLLRNAQLALERALPALSAWREDPANNPLKEEFAGSVLDASEEIMWYEVRYLKARTRQMAAGDDFTAGVFSKALLEAEAHLSTVVDAGSLLPDEEDSDGGRSELRTGLVSPVHESVLSVDRSELRAAGIPDGITRRGLLWTLGAAAAASPARTLAALLFQGEEAAKSPRLADLIARAKYIGSFGPAKAERQGTAINLLEFDVSKPEALAGIILTFDSYAFTGKETYLDLELGEGTFPAGAQLEFKENSKPDSLIGMPVLVTQGLKPNAKIRIPIAHIIKAAGKKTLGELAIVFRNQTAGETKTGKGIIKGLSFSEDPLKEPMPEDARTLLERSQIASFTKADPREHPEIAAKNTARLEDGWVAVNFELNAVNPFSGVTIDLPEDVNLLDHESIKFVFGPENPPAPIRIAVQKDGQVIGNSITTPRTIDAGTVFSADLRNAKEAAARGNTTGARRIVVTLDENTRQKSGTFRFKLELVKEAPAADPLQPELPKHLISKYGPDNVQRLTREDILELPRIVEDEIKRRGVPGYDRNPAAYIRAVSEMFKLTTPDPKGLTPVADANTIDEFLRNAAAEGNPRSVVRDAWLGSLIRSKAYKEGAFITPLDTPAKKADYGDFTAWLNRMRVALTLKLDPRARIPRGYRKETMAEVLKELERPDRKKIASETRSELRAEQEALSRSELRSSETADDVIRLLEEVKAQRNAALRTAMIERYTQTARGATEEEIEIIIGPIYESSAARFDSAGIVNQLKDWFGDEAVAASYNNNPDDFYTFVKEIDASSAFEHTLERVEDAFNQSLFNNEALKDLFIRDIAAVNRLFYLLTSGDPDEDVLRRDFPDIFTDRSELRTDISGTVIYPPEFGKDIDHTDPAVYAKAAEFKEAIRRYLSIGRGSFGSLEPLISEARKINPSFQTSLPQNDLSRPGAAAVIRIMKEFNLQVFMPLDEYVAPHIRGGTAVISRWAFKPGSWRSESYLGELVWMSEGSWAVREEDPGLQGFNFANAFEGRYLSIDRGSFEQFFPEYYQKIKASAGLPYSMIKDFIDERSVSEAAFSETILGYTAAEERRHVQDDIFSSLVSGDIVGGLERGNFITARDITKPHTFLKNSQGFPPLETLPRTQYEMQIADMQADSLIELAGQTGGLIRRMTELIAARKFDEAYLSFLHQFVRSRRESAAAQELWSQRIPGPYNLGELALFKYSAGNFFIESLLQAPMFRSANITNIAQIAAAFNRETSMETRAVKALGQIQEIYAMHFWSEEEREAKVKGRRQGAAGAEETTRSAVKASAAQTFPSAVLEGVRVSIPGAGEFSFNNAQDAAGQLTRLFASLGMSGYQAFSSGPSTLTVMSFSPYFMKTFDITSPGFAGEIAEIFSARSELRASAGTAPSLTITEADAFSRTAAREVAAKVRELQRTLDRDVNIVFATGNTMVGFLDELSKQEGIDWSRVQAFHLDEYAGLSTEHPASFAYFLNKNLFSKVPLPRENIHYVNGANYEDLSAENVSTQTAAYLAELNRLGGADIVMLGVGLDGHLAFNEPPDYSDPEAHMQVVTLDESTIAANEPDYPEIRTNPYAVTLGMADILAGRYLFFLANKAKKADIVQKSLEGPVTPGVPASYLQRHPGVTVILDEEAAANLTNFQNAVYEVSSAEKILEIAGKLPRSAVSLLTAAFDAAGSESWIYPEEEPRTKEAVSKWLAERLEEIGGKVTFPVRVSVRSNNLTSEIVLLPFRSELRAVNAKDIRAEIEYHSSVAAKKDFIANFLRKDGGDERPAAPFIVRSNAKVKVLVKAAVPGLLHRMKGTDLAKVSIEGSAVVLELNPASLVSDSLLLAELGRLLPQLLNRLENYAAPQADREAFLKAAAADPSIAANLQKIREVAGFVPSVFQKDYAKNFSGVRQMILDAAEDLKNLGYPYPDLLDTYAALIREKSVEMPELKAKAGVIMGKIFLEAETKMEINVPANSELINLLRKTAGTDPLLAMDLFTEALAGTLAREAWGLWMYRAHPRDFQEIRRVLGDGKEKYYPGDSLGWPDARWTGYFEEFGNDIERQMAHIVAGEVFEARRELEFEKWAKGRGLYDFDRLDRADLFGGIGSLSSLHATAKTLRDFKEDFQFFKAYTQGHVLNRMQQVMAGRAMPKPELIHVYFTFLQMDRGRLRSDIFMPALNRAAAGQGWSFPEDLFDAPTRAIYEEGKRELTLLESSMPAADRSELRTEIRFPLFANTAANYHDIQTDDGPVRVYQAPLTPYGGAGNEEEIGRTKKLLDAVTGSMLPEGDYVLFGTESGALFAAKIAMVAREDLDEFFRDKPVLKQAAGGIPSSGETFEFLRLVELTPVTRAAQMVPQRMLRFFTAVLPGFYRPDITVVFLGRKPSITQVRVFKIDDEQHDRRVEFSFDLSRSELRSWDAFPLYANTTAHYHTVETADGPIRIYQAPLMMLTREDEDERALRSRAKDLLDRLSRTVLTEGDYVIFGDEIGALYAAKVSLVPRDEAEKAIADSRLFTEVAPHLPAPEGGIEYLRMIELLPVTDAGRDPGDFERFLRDILPSFYADENIVIFKSNWPLVEEIRAEEIEGFPSFDLKIKVYHKLNRSELRSEGAMSFSDHLEELDREARKLRDDLSNGLEKIEAENSARTAAGDDSFSDSLSRFKKVLASLDTVLRVIRILHEGNEASLAEETERDIALHIRKAGGYANEFFLGMANEMEIAFDGLGDVESLSEELLLSLDPVYGGLDMLTGLIETARTEEAFEFQERFGETDITLEDTRRMVAGDLSAPLAYAADADEALQILRQIQAEFEDLPEPRRAAHIFGLLTLIQATADFYSGRYDELAGIMESMIGGIEDPERRDTLMRQWTVDVADAFRRAEAGEFMEDELPPRLFGEGGEEELLRDIFGLGEDDLPGEDPGTLSAEMGNFETVMQVGSVLREASDDAGFDPFAALGYLAGWFGDAAIVRSYNRNSEAFAAFINELDLLAKGPYQAFSAIDDAFNRSVFYLPYLTQAFVEDIESVQKLFRAVAMKESPGSLRSRFPDFISPGLSAGEESGRAIVRRTAWELYDKREEIIESVKSEYDFAAWRGTIREDLTYEDILAVFEWLAFDIPDPARFFEEVVRQVNHESHKVLAAVSLAKDKKWNFSGIDAGNYHMQEIGKPEKIYRRFRFLDFLMTQKGLSLKEALDYELLQSYFAEFDELHDNEGFQRSELRTSSPEEFFGAEDMSPRPELRTSSPEDIPGAGDPDFQAELQTRQTGLLESSRHHIDSNKVVSLSFSAADLKAILTAPVLLDQDPRQVIEWELKKYAPQDLALQLSSRLMSELKRTERSTNGEIYQMEAALKRMLPEMFENSLDSYMQKYGIKTTADFDGLIASGTETLTMDFYVFSDGPYAFIRVVDNAFGKEGAETSEQKVELSRKGVLRIGGRHRGLLTLHTYFDRTRLSKFYRHFTVSHYDRKETGDPERGSVVEIKVDAAPFNEGRSELRAAELAALAIVPSGLIETKTPLIDPEQASDAIVLAVQSGNLDVFAARLIESIRDLARRIEEAGQAAAWETEFRTFIDGLLLLGTQGFSKQNVLNRLQPLLVTADARSELRSKTGLKAGAALVLTAAAIFGINSMRPETGNGEKTQAPASAPVSEEERPVQFETEISYDLADALEQGIFNVGEKTEESSASHMVRNDSEIGQYLRIAYNVTAPSANLGLYLKNFPEAVTYKEIRVRYRGTSPKFLLEVKGRPEAVPGDGRILIEDVEPDRWKTQNFSLTAPVSSEALNEVVAGITNAFAGDIKKGQLDIKIELIGTKEEQPAQQTSLPALRETDNIAALAVEDVSSFPDPYGKFMRAEKQDGRKVIRITQSPEGWSMWKIAEANRTEVDLNPLLRIEYTGSGVIYLEMIAADQSIIGRTRQDLGKPKVKVVLPPARNFVTVDLSKELLDEASSYFVEYFIAANAAEGTDVSISSLSFHADKIPEGARPTANPNIFYAVEEVPAYSRTDLVLYERTSDGIVRRQAGSISSRFKHSFTKAFVSPGGNHVVHEVHRPDVAGKPYSIQISRISPFSVHYIEGQGSLEEVSFDGDRAVIKTTESSGIFDLNALDDEAVYIDLRTRENPPADADTPSRGGGRSELRRVLLEGIVKPLLGIDAPNALGPDYIAEVITAAGDPAVVAAEAEEIIAAAADEARETGAVSGEPFANDAVRYRNLQLVLKVMEEIAANLQREAELLHGESVKDIHSGAPLAVALDAEGRIATRSGLNITPDSLAAALERYRALLSKVNFVSDSRVSEVLRNIKIPNKRVAAGDLITGGEVLSLIGDARLKNTNLWQLDIEGEAGKLDAFTSELILNLMILIGGLVNYGGRGELIRKTGEAGNPVTALLEQYPGLAVIIDTESLKFDVVNGKVILKFQAALLQQKLGQEALARAA